MFIFYYAVLSEVSPPTALSPFAAAAITGGDPYKTTLQAWKYTLPAFLVPFVFVLDPQGVGLLLKIPKAAPGSTSSMITVKTALGLAALAAAAQGWALRRTTRAERGAAHRWPACCWCSRACSRRCWRPSPAATSAIPRHLAWRIAAAVLLKQRMQPARPSAGAA